MPTTDILTDASTSGGRPTPTSIDLFCGAGGLSLGLKAQGFKIALAGDNWDAAFHTYVENFPEVPFCHSDAKLLTGAQLLHESGLSNGPTLVAGGPPCQGFSSAGRRDANDPRNTLVSIFARLAAELMPPFVLFENVEGFLTAGDGQALIALLDPLLEAGYRVHLRKVNAANYGVPQLRKRVVAIGALNRCPNFPAPTHSAYGMPGALRAGTTLPPTATLLEGIAHLPPPDSGMTNGSDHQAASLSDLDLQRAALLREGETMRSLPPALQHQSYLRRAFRRVMDGMPTERRGGAPAGLRRLRGDEPCKAITAAAIREFLHPKEDRFLTLRECASLQTFPSNFKWVGTVSEKALLIGNAVPPQLAKVFAQGILTDIEQPEVKLSGSGALLSFVPTLSEGMSPALRQVARLVERRYGQGASQPLEVQMKFDA